jgi:hypothetical protein
VRLNPLINPALSYDSSSAQNLRVCIPLPLHCAGLAWGLSPRILHAPSSCDVSRLMKCCGDVVEAIIKGRERGEEPLVYEL